MKKLLLGLALLTSIPGVAATQEMKGTVYQAECDSRRMIGNVELRNVENGVMTVEWFKVQSKQLCEKSSTSPMFFGKVSKLVELSSNNMNTLKKAITTFILEDGIITAYQPEKTKYTTGKAFNSIEDVEYIGTNREVLDWYFGQKFNK